MAVAYADVPRSPDNDSDERVVHRAREMVDAVRRIFRAQQCLLGSYLTLSLLLRTKTQSLRIECIVGLLSVCACREVGLPAPSIAVVRRSVRRTRRAASARESHDCVE